MSYGSATMMPKPMFNPGYRAPEPEYGGDFYNQGATASGRVKLKQFLKVFSGIFEVNTTAAEDATPAETDETNIDDIESVVASYLSGYSVEDDDSSEPAALRGQQIAQARRLQAKLAELRNMLGGSAEHFLEQLSEAGAYDAQLIFPLIRQINRLDLAVGESDIDALRRSLLPLDIPQLRDLCEQKGIEYTAEETKEELIDKILTYFVHSDRHMARFDEASWKEMENKNTLKALQPALSYVGANVVNISSQQSQMARYNAAEKRAQRMEKDRKQDMAEARAKSKNLIKEMIQKKDSAKKTEKS